MGRENFHHMLLCNRPITEHLDHLITFQTGLAHVSRDPLKQTHTETHKHAVIAGKRLRHKVVMCTHVCDLLSIRLDLVIR